MKCAFQEDTGVYVLGVLTASEHRRMRLHLKDCPACRADVADLLAVLPILKNLPEVFRPRSCRALFIDWSKNN